MLLETIRKNHNDHLTKKHYAISVRMIVGGFQTVPYNEVFLLVGGVGHISNVSMMQHLGAQAMRMLFLRGTGLIKRDDK